MIENKKIFLTSAGFLKEKGSGEKRGQEPF